MSQTYQLADFWELIASGREAAANSWEWQLVITGSEDMTALGLTQDNCSQEKAPVQEIVDAIGGKNEHEIGDIKCKGIECVWIMKE